MMILEFAPCPWPFTPYRWGLAFMGSARPAFRRRRYG